MYSSTESAIPAGLHRFAFNRCYEGVDASVPTARDDFRDAVEPLKLGQETVEDVLLCLSELAANAVRHTGQDAHHKGFRVAAAVRGRLAPVLRLEVHDHAVRHRPKLPPPDLDAIPFDSTSGRGLALVAALSSQTGCDRAPGWKAVWCELRVVQANMVTA